MSCMLMLEDAAQLSPCQLFSVARPWFNRHHQLELSQCRRFIVTLLGVVAA
jgi:hypothetical protein